MAHLIIDGYNLIRSSTTLTLIESKNFEQGRLALIQKLAAYKKLKNHQITVVFDAGSTFNRSIEKETVGGIQILYTEGSQTADEVIIQMAQQLRDGVLIVSSDNEIIHAAKKAGCAVLQSDEFEKRLNEALLYDRHMTSQPLEEEKKPLHKRWITQKKGPSKRLPKEKRKALAKLKDL